MSKFYCRVNGRGNAWPVQLGEDHVFYDRSKFEDLSNTSFSLIKYKDEVIQVEDIEWEVLIDVGHGIVQYLIQNSNRIPDAVFLTHPHIDHTLGLDWVVQSHFRKSKTKYPVYASRYCFQQVIQSFPHLEEMIVFNELIYGEDITLFKEVKVTPFPCFHGKFAFGATMLLFDIATKKTVITGDILLPVLRNKDKEALANIDLLITDANNRFPYPKSNHWSIVSDKKFKYDHSFYNKWIESISSNEIILPHIQSDSNQKIIEYFNEWLLHFSIFEIEKCVFDFAKSVKPKLVWLTHYSGNEDEKYHGSEKLSDFALERWCNEIKPSVIEGAQFQTPKVGDMLEL